MNLSSMTETEMGAQRSGMDRLRNVLVRIATFLLLAFAIGAVLNHVEISLERSSRPAGFARGLLQGALMPMSMPNLLVGKDVAIYAQNNIGLRYKLGYTAGVNSCGAIFFGFLYWRVSRWKSPGAKPPA
jgi:hypothetical protein